jgi:RHS repeat-associated protein
VGLTYTWDAAGNLASFTGYTGTVTYTYDALNRVASVTEPGPVTTTFAYADLVEGVHDRKTTTYPGGTVQTELVDQAGTPDGTLVSRRLTTSRAYFLHDGLGSTIALVQGDGTIRNRYAYDPYGQTTTTCPTGSCLSNPFQYTGAEHDETTGLYKIGHRYYQPDHGRWTQPDPLGARVNTVMPTEAHPYLYVGCNPTNRTDPTGLCDVVDWITGATGTVAGGAATAHVLVSATTISVTAGVLGLIGGVAALVGGVAVLTVCTYRAVA